jgi:hypothetical protein
MEFGPEPMPVVQAERFALPELRGIWISWNDLEDEAMDGGEQFAAG